MSIRSRNRRTARRAKARSQCPPNGNAPTGTDSRRGVEVGDRPEYVVNRREDARNAFAQSPTA